MSAAKSTLRIRTVLQPFLLLSFALLNSTLTAQTIWSSFNAGLYGASIRTFARDDRGTFVAATNGGIYRRDPDRMTWELVLGGGDAGGVAGFRDGLFLGGIDNTIYLSDDGGTSWRTVDTTLYARTFGSTESGVLLVAGSREQSVPSEMIVRRSTDGGSTWNPTTIVDGLSGDVHFARGKSNITLAATLSGVFVSSDDGMTWEATPFANPAYDIATNDGNVYVASAAGVFVTHDDGGSWGVADTLRARQIVFDGGAIFAAVAAGPDGGLYRTGTFGDAWERVTSVVPRSIALDRDNNLWLAVGTLPLYSTDRGDSWSAGEVGMTSTDVGTMFAFDDDLFAIVRSALYRYRSGDGEWSLLDGAPMVSRLTAWPSTANRRIVAVGRETSPLPPFPAEDVVYLSENNGDTWKEQWRGGLLTPPSIIGPSCAVIGYAWPAGSTTRGGGILTTFDAGATWDSIPLANSVTAMAADKKRILVGSIEVEGTTPRYLGMQQSSDSGSTWTIISDSVGARAIAWIAPDVAIAITAHARLKDGDSTLSNDALSRVTDGTLEPVLVDTIPTSILFVRPGIILIDAVLPDARTVTLRSTNNGETWGTITIDDTIAGRLTEVIGGDGNGLFGTFNGRPSLSADGGATWTTNTKGLPRANAMTIARRSSGYVVVGTGGDGVFMAADPLDVTSSESGSEPPVRLRLHNDVLEISTDRLRSITIDAINVLGEKIESIIERLSVDGRLVIPSPLVGHIPGFYLIRARWGDGSTVVSGIIN